MGGDIYLWLIHTDVSQPTCIVKQLKKGGYSSNYLHSFIYGFRHKKLFECPLRTRMVLSSMELKF